jgi:hypothetical protein
VFDPGRDYDHLPGCDVRSVEYWPDNDYFKQKMFRLVIVPSESSDIDIVDEFVYTVARAREIGNLLLVCDEVGDYSKGPGVRALTKLHRNGHKLGIVTILISQRAVDIPLGARATATQVDSFLQDNEQDLQQLHEMYDGSHPGYSDKVRQWKPKDGPVTWKRRTLYN